MNKIDKILAWVLFPFLLITNLSIRLTLALIGMIVIPPVTAYCQYKGLSKYPKLFYIWDNDEDGYHGNKMDWWDEYLYNKKGKTFRVKGIKRWWRSVVWSAIRNPVNNMQRVPLLSWSAESPKKVDIRHYNKITEWVIYFKPKGSFITHICFSRRVKDFTIRGGLKLKPWYYPEYGGKVLPIEEARKRTTYTFSIFK